MSFEAEVIPLFIGGISIVSILELIVGCIMLRKLQKARNSLICHAVSMFIAFVFLIRSIFANWLNANVGIKSISNSVNIGLLGVFWAISVFALLYTIYIIIDNSKTEQ